MDNVIDFIAKKKERDEEKRTLELQRFVERNCSFNHPEQIDQLVMEKSLVVNDHKLFLGFLAHLTKKNIEPLKIFQDVFSMSKSEFEYTYNMKWWSVVQLAITFLSILKQNDLEEYFAFLNSPYK